MTTHFPSKGAFDSLQRTSYIENKILIKLFPFRGKKTAIRHWFTIWISFKHLLWWFVSEMNVCYDFPVIICNCIRMYRRDVEINEFYVHSSVQCRNALDMCHLRRSDRAGCTMQMYSKPGIKQGSSDGTPVWFRLVVSPAMKAWLFDCCCCLLGLLFGLVVIVCGFCCWIVV